MNELLKSSVRNSQKNFILNDNPSEFKIESELDMNIDMNIEDSEISSQYIPRECKKLMEQ
jgi:hypothetical protein